MKFTYRQRVQKGIANLDGAASNGKIPKHWRNYIDLNSLRLANLEKSIPAQILGSYEQARKTLNLIGNRGGSHYGFTHYPFPYRDNVHLLRKEWEEALKSDDCWKKEVSESWEWYTRKINGIRYLIHKDRDGINYGITYALAGKIICVDPVYTTISSAKRAVRKLTSRRD